MPSSVLPGAKLPNGATLVARRKDKSDHCWVVLAIGPAGDYVTWLSDEQDVTYWGHYYNDFKDAVADYESR